MKKIFFLILLSIATIASAQNVKINRPSHDGSRFVATDFDNCGGTVGTILGDYQVSLGFTYYQSPEGTERWYMLIQISMANYKVEAYKDDRMLIQLSSGKMLELKGLYNTSSDISETLVKTFGFQTPYFSFLNRTVTDIYYTTQFFEVDETTLLQIIDGVKQIKIETSLNPCWLTDKSEVKSFRDNCKYGYDAIKRAVTQPKFYEGFE